MLAIPLVVLLRIVESVVILQNFEFARDLFAAFCSVLIRMYLNYTVECFSDFLSRVSLSDEQKIIQKILKHAYIFLSKFWDETSYKFF